jgi:hypothetical protein
MLFRLLLLLLVGAASMTVSGQKRLKTVNYKTHSYTLQYDSDGNIQGYDIEPVGGKVTSYNGMQFTYDGDQLASIKLGSERYDITWASGRPTHLDEYRNNTRLMYFSDATYNDQCPDAAIAFAIDFCAIRFADPEDAGVIATFYALAPYLGTLTNDLVGNVTATDGEAGDSEIDYYNCDYTYVKDNDGYPIEVHVDVTDDYWHSGVIHTYTHNRVIYLEWEGMAGISPQTISQDESTIWYDLSGRRVKHPTNGVYIYKGKKIVK